MIITDLVKKGKSELYKTYIDNRYVCLLQAETIIKHKLKVGIELDEIEFGRIREESDDLSCVVLITNYISSSLKTRKQIFDHFKEKGFLSSSINKALDKLCEYGYIDDKYYAENFVRSKQNYKGKMYIKSALKSKGVSDDIIESVLCDFCSDEDTIISLAQKFVKNKQGDTKLKAKLFRHLLSKGFEYGEVISACNKVLKDD